MLALVTLRRLRGVNDSGPTPPFCGGGPLGERQEGPAGPATIRVGRWPPLKDVSWMNTGILDAIGARPPQAMEARKSERERESHSSGRSSGGVHRSGEAPRRRWGAATPTGQPRVRAGRPRGRPPRGLQAPPRDAGAPGRGRGAPLLRPRAPRSVVGGRRGGRRGGRGGRHRARGRGAGAPRGGAGLGALLDLVLEGRRAARMRAWTGYLCYRWSNTCPRSTPSVQTDLFANPRFAPSQSRRLCSLTPFHLHPANAKNTKTTEILGRGALGVA